MRSVLAIIADKKRMFLTISSSSSELTYVCSNKYQSVCKRGLTTTNLPDF